MPSEFRVEVFGIAPIRRFYGRGVMYGLIVKFLLIWNFALSDLIR